MKIKDTLLAQRTQQAREKASGVLDHPTFGVLKQPSVTAWHLEVAGSLVQTAQNRHLPRSDVKKAQKLLKAMENEASAAPMLELAQKLHDNNLLSEGAFRRLGDGVVSKVSLAEVAFAQRAAKTPELKQAADELMGLAQESHDALPWLSKAFEAYVDRSLVRSTAIVDAAEWAKDFDRINIGEASLGQSE